MAWVPTARARPPSKGLAPPEFFANGVSEVSIFDELKNMGFDAEPVVPGKQQVVWRFRFEKVEEGTPLFKFSYPANGQILNAMVSGSSGGVDLWVLVDPDEEKVDHYFGITMTGVPVKVKLGTYVSTLMAHTLEADGTPRLSAMHIFEVHPFE